MRLGAKGGKSVVAPVIACGFDKKGRQVILRPPDDAGTEEVYREIIDNDQLMRSFMLGEKPSPAEYVARVQRIRNSPTAYPWRIFLRGEGEEAEVLAGLVSVFSVGPNDRLEGLVSGRLLCVVRQCFHWQDVGYLAAYFAMHYCLYSAGGPHLDAVEAAILQRNKASIRGARRLDFVFEYEDREYDSLPDEPVLHFFRRGLPRQS